MVSQQLWQVAIRRLFPPAPWCLEGCVALQQRPIPDFSGISVSDKQFLSDLRMSRWGSSNRPGLDWGQQVRPLLVNL